MGMGMGMDVGWRARPLSHRLIARMSGLSVVSGLSLSVCRRLFSTCIHT